MSFASAVHRNLWALTVLCLLRERPMHPYEMQRTIRLRHKDDFLELKRGSLYHAIGRLERAHLIEVVETSREGRRPERTTYRLTEAGEQEALDWLREMLAKPVREPSQFLAALSFAVHLSPREVLDQLQERISRLELEIVGLNAVLQTVGAQIARIHLVEGEHARAMLQAEVAWVRSLMEEIRTGRLVWDTEALLRACRSPSTDNKAEDALQ
jgi:DNA-binding PadR family transcriptional regulator